MSEYVDIREIHPDYTDIPCIECDSRLLVTQSFAYNYDEWYCEDCKPEKLKNIDTRNRVTVRL